MKIAELVKTIEGHVALTHRDEAFRRVAAVLFGRFLERHGGYGGHG